ncbi:hypothetical protein SKAU_G00092730 [Synaphobranchus kaupii]|uniref:S-adenosyl-L-methionine-dependent tRNA 4-demethylwyosine synthase TYW1 n=1 Tax=Synaphobranchus kaupii TaxID=118154 RepID=A0A9Q1FX02_SYNKA|nr:hypothetical protein SKAU_G00092730 [Synaphobranchus kaupii]
MDKTARITLLLVSLNVLNYTFGADVQGPLKNAPSRTEGYFMPLWQNRLYVYTAAAVFFGIWFTLKLTLKKEKADVPVNSGLHSTEIRHNGYLAEKENFHVLGVKIFYGSQTGTAKGFAEDLAGDIEIKGLRAEVIDLTDYDPDENISNEGANRVVCVFLLATYTDGQPTKSAEWFCKWLEEASTDFRYGQTYLKGLRYAVFGLGNSVYIDYYNTVGRNVDKWLWMLSGTRVLTRGEGDCNVVKSRNGSLQADFLAWKGRFLSCLGALANGEKSSCSSKCTNCNCKNHEGQQEQPEVSEVELFESSSDAESEDEKTNHDIIDVEDLGNIMNRIKKAKQKDHQMVKLSKKKKEEPREMITPSLRAALTKQGYKLIGSHSGVKLCRWTKSMLRGRGGCYKHTFYGIESHRCMETTPSLACANKCVFCWRHHTNPVGTEWRWKMDPPEQILQEAMENHRNMIWQFRGVPGVRPERFEEGMAVKHCALSLVGEPIMYPEINTFIKLLHRQHISSFLVTNAQFPEEIRSLEPVTQLYVSVDASTSESLRKIDRPLFKDFWHRFLDCLRALGEKQQRTVYRLTLVKAWNVDELKAYAELVALGKPDFIEVKGVTYCGESSASTLTMANVPWHEEVVHFVQELADLLPDYDIASEHKHSNCLLIAHHKFKVEGEWWTWIDYERFHELIHHFKDSGGTRTFSASDYMAKTPDWAVFGARERGFDPADTRFQRKNKTKDISGC